MFGNRAAAKTFILFVTLIGLFGGLLGCARPIYQDSASHSQPANFNKLERPPANIEKLGLQASITWQKMQTEEEYGAFFLKFWRPNLGDRSPVPQDITQDLDVKLMMPSMGHGSSPVTILRVDVGTYLIEDVYFSMPGAWEIQFSLQDQNGQVYEASIPYHF
ncbi:MAG: hypothetical protein ACXWC9_09035 [Pseudobdellovibrionaceae bacterium]